MFLHPVGGVFPVVSFIVWVVLPAVSSIAQVVSLVIQLRDRNR